MTFSVQDIGISNAVNTTNYEVTNPNYISSESTIDVNKQLTYLTNTGDEYTITLPQSLYPGQQHTIVVTSVESSNSNDITLQYNNPFFTDNTDTFGPFGSLGDTILLISTSVGWHIVYSAIKL